MFSLFLSDLDFAKKERHRLNFFVDKVLCANDDTRRWSRRRKMKSLSHKGPLYDEK